MASPKTLARLEAQIQRRVAHCLQFEIADPRSTFVTITKVELASDIASAKVYYSVLGDEGELSKAAHLFKSAGGFIQRQVASILRTRRTPHLRFIYDDSIAEAARLDLLIREARKRDREINPEAAEPDAAPSGTEEEPSDLQVDPREEE